MSQLTSTDIQQLTEFPEPIHIRGTSSNVSESQLVWISDDNVSTCSDCGLRFGAFKRRHHCRICGYIYCSACSNHSVFTKQGNLYDDEEQRCCSACFAFISDTLELSKSVFISTDSPRASLLENSLSKIYDTHIRSSIVLLLGSGSVYKSWYSIIHQFATESVRNIRVLPPPLGSDEMDPLDFVTVRTVLSGTSGDSFILNGVVFRSSVCHRLMRHSINSPRILLLMSSLELTHNAKVSDLVELFRQEKERTDIIVTKIMSLKPDVLLVQGPVSRLIQEQLYMLGVVLFINVKISVIRRVSRATGAIMLSSIQQAAFISPDLVVGTCSVFKIWKPVPNESAYAVLDGCKRHRHCTICLHGSDRNLLKRVKSVIKEAIVLSYNSQCEVALLTSFGAAYPRELTNDSIGELQCTNIPMSPIYTNLPETSTRMPNTLRLSNHIYVSEFSQLSEDALTLCEEVSTRKRCFYRTGEDGDIADFSIGGFLSLYCTLIDWRCPNLRCRSSRIHKHVHSFCHATGRLEVRVRYVEPLESTHLSESGHQKITTWSYCSVCEKTVGSPIPLCEDASNFSFSKFLEVFFLNAIVTSTDPTCGHRLFRDHVRFFQKDNVVIRFYFRSSKPYTIKFRNMLYDNCATSNDDGRLRTVWQLDIDELQFYSESLLQGLHTSISEGMYREDAELVSSVLDVAARTHTEFLSLIHSPCIISDVYTCMASYLVLRKNTIISALRSMINSWVSLLSINMPGLNWSPEMSFAKSKWYLSASDVHYPHPVIPNCSFIIAQDEPSSIIAATLSSLEYALMISGRVPPFVDLSPCTLTQVFCHRFPSWIEELSNYSSIEIPSEFLSEPPSLRAADKTGDGSIEGVNTNNDESLQSTHDVNIPLSPYKLSIDSDIDELHDYGPLDLEIKSEQMGNNVHLESPRGQNDSISFLHTVSIGDDLYFECVVYYPIEFERIRSYFFAEEFDFIGSLARCTKWVSSGGKSGSNFAKTADERYILKYVKRRELKTYLSLALKYFSYMDDSLIHRYPSALVKILGVFKVTCKRSTSQFQLNAPQYIIVMPNILYGSQMTNVFDLKGTLRNRMAKEQIATGSDPAAVLLDENFLHCTFHSASTINLLYLVTNGFPLPIDSKAKDYLTKSVYNDTLFLSKEGIVDYSLLVGIDTINRELVVGIIDYLRLYAWVEQLETSVKSLGKLAGIAAPTVISPDDYKTRFRAAIVRYFVLAPHFEEESRL